jgi:hypothetical protein
MNVEPPRRVDRKTATYSRNEELPMAAADPSTVTKRDTAPGAVQFSDPATTAGSSTRVLSTRSLASSSSRRGSIMPLRHLPRSGRRFVQSVMEGQPFVSPCSWVRRRSVQSPAHGDADAAETWLYEREQRILKGEDHKETDCMYSRL